MFVCGEIKKVNTIIKHNDLRWHRDDGCEGGGRQWNLSRTPLWLCGEMALLADVIVEELITEGIEEFISGYY